MRILWHTSISTPLGSRTSPCTWFAEPPNLQEGRRHRPPFRDFETGTTVPLGRTGRTSRHQRECLPYCVDSKDDRRSPQPAASCPNTTKLKARLAASVEVMSWWSM